MRRLLVFAVAAIGLASCSGSGATTPSGTSGSVATVSITPATAALVAAQTGQLTATAKDSAGNTLSGQTVTWSADRTAVATVSSSGLVTAVSPGTATVTAEVAGKSGTATITVSGLTEVNTVGATGGTVIADHGNVTLGFPAGAVATSMPVSVTRLAALITPPSGYIGTPYELGPTGTQFAQPVTLSFPYSPASLPAGFDPTRLALYTLIGSNWQRVAGSWADTVAHTVTGLIPHFSEWVPCGDPCYVSAPDVELYTGASTSFTVPAGQSVHIGANGREWNFTGGVTITPQGLPTGVTGSVGSYSADNSPLTISFTAAASVPGGSYPFSMHTTAPSAGLDFLTPYTLQVIGQAYTMSVNPLAVNMTQSSSATSTLTFARQGAFAGAIALSAENLPAGVTASFAPASVSETGTTSTLTLVATANATLGGSAPVIRAKTASLPDATATLNLFITTSNASGFTLAGAPASVHVTSGGSGSTGIQTTRTGGFIGTIVYTVSGLPAGLSASVAPTAVADSLSLTVTATSVAIGDYPITVTATSGSTVRQVVVSVDVAAPGHLAMHLDYSGCTTARPVWLGFQDGSASFVRVTGVGDVYDFTLTSSTGAVAVVLPTSTGESTMVTYGTQSELGAFGSTISCSSVVGKTVNFSVINPSDAVQVGMGTGYNVVTSGSTVQSASLFNVALGPQDATAFLQGAAPKMILRRDQNIANGGSLAPFDFTGAEAFTPVSAGVSAPGADAVGMSYFTRGPGCPVTTMYGGFLTFNPTSVMYGVPAALQRPDDLHAAFASAGTATSFRFASSFFHTMAPQTLTFGASLPANSVILSASAPYKQLRASVTFAGDYQLLTLSYTDGANSFAMQASTTFAGGNTVAVAAPALSSTIGYLTSWAPTGSVQYQLNASALHGQCADGVTTKGAMIGGTM